MVVYTKRGDGGETSLGNGLRVAKDDVRIETNGELDELTSLLGILTEYAAHDEVLLQQLMDVQQLLMLLMAHVADNTRRVDNAAFEAKVREMERYIDANSPRHAFCFVRPGGNLLTAHLHYARAKARTCERRLWSLQRTQPIPACCLQFINRLSDFLFVAALQAQQELSTTCTK